MAIAGRRRKTVTRYTRRKRGAQQSRFGVKSLLRIFGVGTRRKSVHPRAHARKHAGFWLKQGKRTATGNIARTKIRYKER